MMVMIGMMAMSGGFSVDETTVSIGIYDNRQQLLPTLSIVFSLCTTKRTVYFAVPN